MEMRRSYEGPEVVSPQDLSAGSDKYFHYGQDPSGYDKEKAYLSQSKYTVDIVALGTDNGVWQNYFEKDWDPWIGLGGMFKSPPNITSWGTSHSDIFAVGTDNAMYHIAWNTNTWSPWESLGGNWEPEPAVVVSNPNQLELFAVGAGDDALWHKQLVGSSWQNGESLMGFCNTAPVAVSTQSQRANVFCLGADASMRTNTLSSGKWSGWTVLQGIFSLSL